MEGLARRWPGRGPWDEVWFLEVTVGPDTSIWLRYTLADGPHRRGLATWAIASAGGQMFADQGQHRLGALLPNSVLDIPDALYVSDTEARGVAGDAEWSLTLHNGPRKHRIVPRLVERLGVGRTYAPAGLDLHVSGTVRIGTKSWSVQHAPAVLGHIWGATNRTQSWAWCHAQFPEGDVLFEGLSAVLGPLPPLTSIGLWIGDRHIDLSGPLQLPRTRSHLGPDEWRFEARQWGLQVEGVARLADPSRVATVRYVDPGDGSPRHCRNSGLSSLELHIQESGRSLHLTTNHAAFELAARGEPVGPMLLSD